MKRVANGADSFSIPVLNNTANVDTTASFAIKPVKRAVEAFQLPNPKGVKTGAISEPIAASILSLLSETTLNRISNLFKNHITMDATNIMVNALVMKSFVFSHNKRKVFFTVGSL